MLRAFIVTVLAALCLSGLSARSDDVPTLDVNPVCHGIATQGELEEGLRQTSFQQCVQSEQATRDEIKKAWSSFSASDKSHCVALAKTGGESSYTELLTCMEMARDVRKLHSEADNSSAPVPEGLPAPVGHRQPTEPAPAASSWPPSTNEPPIGADSTLKELERVKADAQNAIMITGAKGLPTSHYDDYEIVVD